MAIINIVFNDTNYSIDDSSLSATVASLQHHLSTVMNGSGAVINLNGTSYDVDSAKLSTATNDFVSHLENIPGSGLKVVVDGVEYSVDLDKVQSAIFELDTVLGNLSNLTPDGVGLLSSDNLILKDSNGLFLIAKLDN